MNKDPLSNYSKYKTQWEAYEDRRKTGKEECLDYKNCYIFVNALGKEDRLCGLVVRVSGYRYRGLGFDSRRYQIFWVVVGLERGPLSLARSIEELLE